MQLLNFKEFRKALATSIAGPALSEDRLEKMQDQRDAARAQRDESRAQRDRYRDDVTELSRRVAELEQERKTRSAGRYPIADTVGPGAPDGDPARHAVLLKRELFAETSRVQALERNLDIALQRTSELESLLSKTRAMLAVAIGGGTVEPDAANAALVEDPADIASTLSRALVAALRRHPAAEGAGGGALPRAILTDLTSWSPFETPDVVDDGREAARFATKSRPDASDQRAAATPARSFVTARLPKPAILKGKPLSAARANDVQAERQLQIDRFVADGEYARIEALKDIHKGRRAFLIGNGPSLAKQDLSKLDGEITFVANWFANHDGFDQIRPRYYAISSHEMFGGWAQDYPALNESFVRKLTRHQHRPEMFFSHRFRDALREEPALDGYDLKYLVFDRPKFLADEAGGLEFDLAQPMHDGYTVLLTFCVPLAVHMGISEIYMVGCDCDYGIQTGSDARSYFYAPSEHATSSTKAENITRIWADDGPLFRVYELARDACAARGVKMFNATAGGRLEILPRVGYEDIVG